MDPYKSQEDCLNGQHIKDKFKEYFKKYKVCRDHSKFKGFTELFEPDRASEFIGKGACVRKPVNTCCGCSRNNKNRDSENDDCHHSCAKYFGLIDPRTWEVFEFSFPEGLLFIKNPFTADGQRYWIARCLKDYPFNKDHITNIENLRRRQGKDGKFMDESQTNSVADENFYKDLRWITFGYHHDWDTKVYSEDYKCEFPPDLAELTKYISLVLGYEDFSAEAAIANYYHMDSTLSGHVDKSEKNQYAPLFSLSFGQTALFLIGGETKEEVPLGVYLTSGDIAVMAGRSRLSYHAVPKILPDKSQPWLKEVDDSKSTDNTLATSDDHRSKKLKLSETQHPCSLCDFVESAKFNERNARTMSVLSKWSDFCVDYIKKSRINLNIRQVLFAGQKSLDDQAT